MVVTKTRDKWATMLIINRILQGTEREINRWATNDRNDCKVNAKGTIPNDQME